MSALDNIPSDLNFLSQFGFKFELKRAPTTNYNIIRAQIPGAVLEPVWQDTPFVRIPFGGDHIEYEPLVISFKVDRNLTNYMEIYNWLRSIGKADDYEEYALLEQNPQYTGKGIKSDIVLWILDNAKNPNVVFTFYDCVPTELTNLDFDTEQSDIQYIPATATFRFMNFDFEKII